MGLAWVIVVCVVIVIVFSRVCLGLICRDAWGISGGPVHGPGVLLVGICGLIGLMLLIWRFCSVLHVLLIVSFCSVSVRVGGAFLGLALNFVVCSWDVPPSGSMVLHRFHGLGLGFLGMASLLAVLGVMLLLLLGIRKWSFGRWLRFRFFVGDAGSRFDWFVCLGFGASVFLSFLLSAIRVARKNAFVGICGGCDWSLVSGVPVLNEPGILKARFLE